MIWKNRTKNQYSQTKICKFEWVPELKFWHSSFTCLRVTLVTNRDIHDEITVFFPQSSYMKTIVRKLENETIESIRQGLSVWGSPQWGYESSSALPRLEHLRRVFRENKKWFEARRKVRCLTFHSFCCTTDWCNSSFHVRRSIIKAEIRLPHIAIPRSFIRLIFIQQFIARYQISDWDNEYPPLFIHPEILANSHFRSFEEINGPKHVCHKRIKKKNTRINVYRISSICLEFPKSASCATFFPNSCHSAVRGIKILTVYES